MQSKNLSKRTLIIAALSGFVLSLVFFFSFVPQNSTRDNSALFVENAVVLSNQEQADIGLPARLKIPSINIDTHTEYVGITPDGEMDVPQERANVAWFNLGPRPGESGSAVIAGHYGWQNEEASVFDNLYKLQQGDKLYIEDEKGKVITFMVRESRQYNPEADASDVFGSNDGKAHLNLITCGGKWDKVSKTYSKRLVVFADKE